MSTEASGRGIKCQESDLLALDKPLSILIKTHKLSGSALQVRRCHVRFWSTQSYEP